VNLIVRDPNAALVAISIAASCGAVVMIYLLALDWFGRSAARFAAILFLVSPLTWFHGVVGLTYIVEAFLSALVGYLCWQVCQGRKAFALAAAAALALGAGLRPSFALFLLPLLLFSIRNLSINQIAAALSAFTACLLAWLIPMVEASGGFYAYFHALSSLWHVAGGKQTVFNSSPATSLARMLAIVLACIVCFGPAVFLPTYASAIKHMPRPKEKTFTYFWITPGVLFFSFIFLIFVNSGYLLVVFPPCFIWLGFWASEWYAGFRFPALLKPAVVALLAGIDVLVFLQAPMYCSYRSIRESEASIRGISKGISSTTSPQQTLIIAFDSHFLGFRHAGYYLPQYETVAYPKMRTAVGRRFLAMHNRDTHLSDRLEASRFTQFLLFPLPLDEKQYLDYTAKIKSRFPSADLRTIHAEGHDFVTGPISDLRYLFPDAVVNKDLYTARHEKTPSVYKR
jgi:hypothetical protein